MCFTLIRYSTLIAGILDILQTGTSAQNYTNIFFNVQILLSSKLKLELRSAQARKKSEHD